MKPIGQLLREKRRIESSLSITSDAATKTKKAPVSIEEQIRLLENELLASGDDASDSDSSDGSENDDDGESEDSTSDNLVYEKDKDGNIIRMISKICVEKIQPLSESQLPQPMCSKGSKQKASFKLLKQLKPIDPKRSVVRFADDNNDGVLPKSKEDEANDRSMQQEEQQRRLEKREKKKRPRNEEEKLKKEEDTEKKIRISGLEKTVRELLVNYIPASQEKKAFYCRVCRVESEDIASFEAHKDSEMHDVATKMEKKMSFCVLCRKQFTSPNQLKEHVMGKGHKDYLASVREKQAKEKALAKTKFC